MTYFSLIVLKQLCSTILKLKVQPFRFYDYSWKPPQNHLELNLFFFFNINRTRFFLLVYSPYIVEKSFKLSDVYLLYVFTSVQPAQKASKESIFDEAIRRFHTTCFLQLNCSSFLLHPLLVPSPCPCKESILLESEATFYRFLRKSGSGAVPLESNHSIDIPTRIAHYLPTCPSGGPPHSYRNLFAAVASSKLRRCGEATRKWECQ